MEETKLTLTLDEAKLYQKYANMARNGTLPSGFDQWNLCNKNGWTIAHMAAWYDNLPEGFNQWELSTKTGWTVAHVAAAHKHLPDDFDQWDLVDKNGTTVKCLQEDL